MYWKYNKYPQNDARYPRISTHLEILYVKHTRKVATRADETALGQEDVGIKGSEGPYKKVVN